MRKTYLLKVLSIGSVLLSDALVHVSCVLSIESIVSKSGLKLSAIVLAIE